MNYQETFMAISMMLALNEKEGETRVGIVKEFIMHCLLKKIITSNTNTC